MSTISNESESRQSSANEEVANKEKKDIIPNDNDNDNEDKKEQLKSPKKDDVAPKNISVPSNKILQIVKASVKHSNVEGDISYYDVRVKTAREMWIVRKRYTNFEELHNKLLSEGQRKLPLLPPKYYKMFTDHSNENFIERRRALLDNYVKKLLTNKDAATSQEVINFFHDDQLHKGPRPSIEKEQVPDDVNNNISPAYDGFSDEEYEYPPDQEMTSIDIQSWRRMSDHVLYQIKVGNKNNYEEESGEKTWVVLKRFGQFWEMDQKLRSDFANDPQTIKSLPLPPPRRMKLIYDHMDEDFIRERRVLLQNYLRQMIRLPEVAKNEKFLTFLGVSL